MHPHQQHHDRRHQRLGADMTADCTTFLQEDWMSLMQNLQMQSINCFQHLSAQYIDQVVDIEMKRLKANCKQEEERYVEQMLLDNPIIVERRTLSPAPSGPPPPTPLAPTAMQSSSASSGQSTKLPQAATDATPKTNDNNYHQHSTGNGCSNISSTNNTDSEGNNKWSATTAQEHQLLQQRADSCRRSRINNKIKKAKTKFRHKFMSNKLMQSVGMLECIQKLIDQTEAQLVRQGFSGHKLEKFKGIFGIGRN